MLCCCRGVGQCGVPSCGAVVVVASCGCSWLFVYLSIHPSIHPLVYLHIWKRNYSLRNFSHFRTSQHQKGGKAARRPPFSTLTTAKKNPRDPFAFSRWQHQKRNISAKFPSKMEKWVQSWRFRAKVCCDFPTPTVQSAPATTKWCQVMQSAAPVTQNHTSNPGDWMLYITQPLSRNQCPNLPASLMSMSPVPCQPREIHLSTSFSNVPRLPPCLKCLQNSHVLFISGGLQNPLHLPHQTTCERPKMVEDRQFLAHGVFRNFDLDMRFAPQRRHLSSQKWSNVSVYFTFWLGNVLRATTACTFSTSQFPKVVQAWCVFYILVSQCVSRHNGVQFFISKAPHQPL